jgi:hypothetical protein
MGTRGTTTIRGWEVHRPRVLGDATSRDGKRAQPVGHHDVVLIKIESLISHRLKRSPLS